MEMRKRRLFPALLIFLAAFSLPTRGQEPTPSPSASVATESQEEEEHPDTPASPDGKFAFVVDYDSDDARTIDLIDNESKKVLQRVGEETISSTYFHVLWADDSSRFALMTRIGHPNQGVDVYFRSGNKFRKIKLPTLPKADIPEKMKRGKKFSHVASNNWEQAESWNKDGSLDVTVTNSIDGNGTTITATRNLKLTFDKSGNAKITNNTIKYETEKDDE